MARAKKRKNTQTEFDIVHATPQQIKLVKQEIHELEVMLKEDKARRYPKIQDEALVRKEIRAKKELIKNHSPQKLKGGKANRAYAHAKELKEIIVAAMPSNKTFYQPYPKDSSSFTQEMDFRRAVDQQVAFQTDPRIKEAVRRYKNIMARLDPDDPTVRSIERLRG